MEETQVLELYKLNYSDLILLSSYSSGEVTPSLELERLEATRRAIMETLGPSGPGLLSITAVPNASFLRRRLLRLARKLALLDHETRKRILKEHNLGSDVPLKNPDRNVSSFAMQLKYAELAESATKPNGSIDLCSDQDHCADYNFQNLGNAFKELGYCMMELGLRIAQVCDKAIGGQELEQSLLESGTAKGRLIHYHSSIDNLIVKQIGRRGGSTQKSKKDIQQSIRSEGKQLKGSNFVKNDNKAGSCGNHAKLWQQWHYDYGIFTILTAPMFLESCLHGSMLMDQFSAESVVDQSLVLGDQECPYPSGHSYLQIFDPNKNSLLNVKTSPECFIVQVGESADILSKGKLHSTLHCVCKPAKMDHLSRETFVIFLQPSWSKTLSTFDYSMGQYRNRLSKDGNSHDERDMGEIYEVVPPLSSRLKDGMTFAEFSRETTKQYYGGSGLQSNK